MFGLVMLYLNNYINLEEHMLLKSLPFSQVHRLSPTLSVEYREEEVVETLLPTKSVFYPLH